MEQIIYNTLTYLIVAFAIFITIKKIFGKNPEKIESTCSSGCGACSSKCDLKALVKNNEPNQ